MKRMPDFLILKSGVLVFTGENIHLLKLTII